MISNSTHASQARPRAPHPKPNEERWERNPVNRTTPTYADAHKKNKEPGVHAPTRTRAHVDVIEGSHMHRGSFVIRMWQKSILLHSSEEMELSRQNPARKPEAETAPMKNGEENRQPDISMR